MHLILVPNTLGFNVNTAILFLIGGIAQIFWVVPMVRRWGAPWYYAGIGGTAILIALWVITRMPDNPITGRAGPINEMAITIEIMQSAFIGLTSAILVLESKVKKINSKSAGKDST